MTRHAEESSNLLKAMASTPRLLVLCHLVEGERSVGELLSEIPLSASALSQHLAVLRQKGLVTTRRDAQVIYYALPPGPAVEILSLLYDTFCAAPQSHRHGKRKV
ncbi:MAG: metalloregulator ArsR/SmtB family transcription factor [Gammaproteobacteria bacterium]